MNYYDSNGGMTYVIFVVSFNMLPFL